MLGKVTIGAAAAAALMLGLTRADAAASRCRGLEESACKADAGCAWMPARIAGETKSKATGQLHKRTAKAHCRLR